jgi:integrase
MHSRRDQVIKLKGIQRVRDASGKVRWKYHRATGIALPVDIPESSPAFLEAYLAAEQGEAPANRKGRPAPGTLAATWEAYRRSDTFTALRPSYQRLLSLSADQLMERAGHVPLLQIEARHIRRDLNALGAHAAVKRRKVWRALLAHAIRMGILDADPSAGIEKPKTRKAQQHEPWTEDDVRRFRSRWLYRSPERVAFELLLWTGARISDVVRLGPGMVDRQGWLAFRQSKTGGEVAIPFRRDPPAFADPADLEHLHRALAHIESRHLTWLTTHTGKSRSVKSASQWFARAAREAGNAGKSAHGLRVARALSLAHGGATAHQIGAWTGHESLKEIEHYARQADKRRVLSGAPMPSPLNSGDDAV